MRLTKAKKGNEVLIHFDDHVEDGDSPLRCIVRGKLLSKGPKYVRVEAWTCLSDESTNEANHKTFAILTSTIVGYAIVKPEWIGEAPP